MAEQTNNFPPTPFAKYQGELLLGNNTIDCYVSDTGQRLISLRATVKALTNSQGGNLGEYIGIKPLKPYLNKDFIPGELI